MSVNAEAVRACLATPTRASERYAAKTAIRSTSHAIGAFAAYRSDPASVGAAVRHWFITASIPPSASDNCPVHAPARPCMNFVFHWW